MVGSEDVAEMAELQQRLLAAAASAVKAGGRLVYAVCTLTRAETTAVAEAFVRAHRDFEPLAVVDPLAVDAPPRTPHRQTPQDHGGNGMFVALWRRRPVV
jgi:16S rRNA (cytosine967-C5)-methyltransferase